MRSSHRPLVIASRASLLARAQTMMVGKALAARLGVEVRYCWIESEGDQLADRPLAQAGGKGLFVKAVEAALLDGRADLAVHSLKDLPGADAVPGPLVVAAVPRRADPRDCLIAGPGIDAIDKLPQGAVVGTAGPRRAAQLLRLRPDLRIALIRGNIETRLRKARDRAMSPMGVPYDATLMAIAGLTRGGYAAQAKAALDPATMLPAAGQGALALQCRADDSTTFRRILPLNHGPSAQASSIERGVVKALHGDCHSPIAVFAEPVEADPARRGSAPPRYRVRARVLSPDGRRCAEADLVAPGPRAVEDTLEILENQGASAILKA